MNAMLEDLLDPASLPDPTRTVSVVHTHISMVLVADEYVYKIKKPVNFGFLDFSTLEKRAYYCRREVELNRRLSQDLYLGVVQVGMRAGRHVLGDFPADETVDYAVRMKRIPESLLMKRIFEEGLLSRADLDRVARVLARFHRTAAGGAQIEAFGKPEAFRVNTDENFEQVERFVGKTIDEKAFVAIREWTNRFYERNEALFLQRIREGRIRDCHGDLHMEHICLSDPVSVFDCIEFNDRFRYSDTLADIAFLMMDLEYRGGNDHAASLWECYRDEAHEGEVENLLRFYKVYRAFVRGKVNSFQLDDRQISAPVKDEAARTASSYFRLALEYIEET